MKKIFSSCSTNNIELQVKYNDADKDKVIIFADNKNKAGIYRWVNNLNGKT